MKTNEIPRVKKEGQIDCKVKKNFGTYLIVFHHFWMESKKWEYEILEFEHENRAKEYARAKTFEKQTQFNHCSYKLIELADNVRPRKLSWKERRTGEIAKISF